MSFPKVSLPPPPVPVPPPPMPPALSNKDVRQAGQGDIGDKAAGVASTIATSPEGLSTKASTAQKSLLGS